MENAKDRKSKGKKIGYGCLILLLTVVILVIIGSFIEPPAVQPEKEEQRSEKKEEQRLSATISFDGSQFTITNLDDFNWMNVEMQINPGLLSSGYYLTHQLVEAKGIYTVGALQFANSEGQRFNPIQMKLRTFTIWADTPSGRLFNTGTWQ